MMEDITRGVSSRTHSLFTAHVRLRRLRSVCQVLQIAVCMVCLGTNALADTETIHGRILDPQGTSVAGVKIKLLNAPEEKGAE